MTFQEVLAQVTTWLEHDKRLSYRALQRQFDVVCSDAGLREVEDRP